MTHEALREAAAECLKRAFTGEHSIPSHVIQAAVSVVLSPTPPPTPPIPPPGPF